MDPMAQAQVEEEIQRLCRNLDRVTADFGNAAACYADADTEYKLGYAKALLRLMDSKMAVTLKEATALRDCEDLYRDRAVADAELKALQETSRNLRAQLDALRSINANVRSVVSHG